MRTWYYIGLLLLNMACSHKGIEIPRHSISFNLSMPSSLGLSAGVDDKAINSLLIVQFSENGKLISKSFIPKLSDGQLKLIQIDHLAMNEKIVLYFIANVPTLSDAINDETSLSEFRQIAMPWSNLTEGTIPMMGCVEGIFSATTPIQEVRLSRLACKIDFTITNDIPECLALTGLRVEGIPPIQYLCSETSTPFPLFTQEEALVQNIDHWDGISWCGYLPENRRGTGLATDSYNKNIYTAPKGQGALCTRLVVSGLFKATEQSMEYPVTFTFFPGMNAINDYNLAINSLYKMHINIKGIDNWDSRISYLNGSTVYINAPDSIKQEIPF